LCCKGKLILSQLLLQLGQERDNLPLHRRLAMPGVRSPLVAVLSCDVRLLFFFNRSGGYLASEFGC
jgi:hypothetical protein